MLKLPSHFRLPRFRQVGEPEVVVTVVPHQWHVLPLAFFPPRFPYIGQHALGLLCNRCLSFLPDLENRLKYTGVQKPFWHFF